jgi:hypothetical protein
MSNKIKFYKVNYSFTTIDIVYADSETESFVIIKGSREKKDGQHESYFKTFEKAKEALLGYWNHKKIVTEGQLNHCLTKLQNSEALKEQ